MAIILIGRSCCTICGETLEAAQDITATSGCAFPPGHHLRDHCDAGMHWDCFWRWPYRSEFSRGYVQVQIDGYREAYGAALVHHDEECVVLVEPAKRALKPEDSGVSEDPLIHVLLWTTNTHCLVAASKWREWLSGPITGRPDEAAILSVIRSRLSSLYPGTSDLLRGLDAEAHVLTQRAFVEKMELKSRQRSERVERDILARNEGLDCVCRRRPECPRCGAPWERLRYYDLRETGRLSCVICQDCQRSSRLEDFDGDAK